MKKILFIFFAAFFFANLIFAQKFMPTKNVEVKNQQNPKILVEKKYVIENYEYKPSNTKQKVKANLSEGFEGNTFPPYDWKIINGGGANTWVRYTDYPISGAASASIYYNLDAHNDWLITPALLPTEGNNNISFWAKNLHATYLDYFNVKISTTGNNEEDFTVTLATDVTPGTVATQYSYDLSAFNEQRIYFAIQAISTDEFRLIVDDFEGPSIYISENDAGITNISSPESGLIGNYNAIVTLKNFGTEALTACNIDYDINGTSETYPWTGNLLQNETIQVTLVQNFNFNTAGIYTIIVTVDLIDDENFTNDQFTKIVEFYPPFYIVPFNEGFELYQIDGQPIGLPMSQFSVLNSSVWLANSSSTSFNRIPRTGSFNATLLFSNTDWLFLPVELEAGKEYIFSVWARQDGTVGSDASIKLSYGNSNNAGGMLNTIVNTTGIVNGDYQKIEGNFSVNSNAVYYLGVLGSANAVPWYISIDDISVVDLTSTYTATFTVSDGTNPINGATINIEDAKVEITTNSDGIATIDLEDGSYVFSVAKDGYVTLTGLEFEINGEPVTVPTITLVETSVTELTSSIPIYPNPSNGVFTLSVDSEYMVKILDITGKIISTSTVNASNNSVDLSKQSNGMYFIQLIGNGTYTIRVVKQ